MYRFLDKLQEQTIFHRLDTEPTRSMAAGLLLMPEGAGRGRRKWNAPCSHALHHAICGQHRGRGRRKRKAETAW